MNQFAIKPKMFFDTMADVQPSQPQVFDYGDRPTFTFTFLPQVIHEGDTLVFAVDNDMTFYDSEPTNLLHSATCMVVNRHEVTAEEETAGSVTMTIDTRTVKFRDVVNGKVRPVDVMVGLYLKTGSDADINYSLLAKGRGFANGIIADYDALPEPITTDEYYTKDEIDGKLDEKADETELDAHTSNTDIHVTLIDKTQWDSKADLNDIGIGTLTIKQGGVSKGTFNANADEDITIEINDNAQGDWNETSSSSPSFIRNKPVIYTQSETDALLDAKADKATTYTKTETDNLLDAKADKSSTYTKTETDGLLGSKANVATTLSGYGIQDAYTKTEVDSKLSTVYKYCGTVATYADLPASGQDIGDVYNVEQADSSHGVKAGDNVAWNGTTWDVLAGYVDLTNYMEKPAVAGSAGQVLTVTAGGSAWQDVPTEIPAGGSAGQVLTMTSSGIDWNDVPDELPASTAQDEGKILTIDSTGEPEWATKETIDDTDYLCFIAIEPNSVVKLNKVGSPSSLVSVEYSLDKINWTTYTWNGTTGDTVTLANIGDRVWWRGNNDRFSSSDSNYFKFYCNGSNNGKVCVSGNVMSLLDKSAKSHTIPTEYCFSHLFYDANIEVDELKVLASDLQRYCYSYMFSSSKITKLPLLSENTDWYSHNRMFANCNVLYDVSNFVPKGYLKNYCYQYMFAQCANLKKATNLSLASRYSDNCLYGMFQNCTSLKTAPSLPSTLGYHWISNIFQNCSSLNSVRVCFTAWDGTATYNWLSGVSATGVFECPAALDTSTRDASHVPAGWTIVRTDAPQSDWTTTDTTEASFIKNKPDIIEAPSVAGTVGQVLTKTATGQEWADPAGGGGDDTNDYLCFMAAQANSTVRMDKSGDGSGPDAITLEYSTDKSTWNDYEWSSNTGTTITLSNINDSVWFRGNNSVFSKGHGGYYKFVLGGKIKAYGTIMSLIDKTCEKKDVPLPSTNEGFFHSLFIDCTALITPPKLTATTLTKQSYAYMFKGCTSLETAPELPATSVPTEGYMYMFNGCTSLRSTPKLPAINLNGSAYSNMFSSCTSLVNCENLPAKTAYYNSMFSGCSSLTKAPAIFATSGNCQSMFSSCTSLVEAPSLSTFTSGQFYNMFQGCTALKKAPDLSRISLGYITFQGMFKNCTSLKIAPRLSQTTNGQECYSNMFENCTNLEIVPLIAGTNQVDRCYKEMFKNCTSLKYVKTNQTSFDQCTNWLNGASSVCYFDCPSTLDTSTRDADHIPSGWIVTHGANELDDGTTSVVEDATTDVYTVCPSSKETGVLTVSSALTLNAYPATSTDIAYAEVVLDIDANATVSAGTNMTFIDTPTVGKRNICVCRWSDGACKLYVTIVEDLPQA